jgi:cytochrome c-type biogenesis protein CcmH
MRRRLGLLLMLLGALAGPAAGQQPATHAREQDVYEVAAQLRCVVCQNLSVADSPSEMANQMRAVIRQRLATGERHDQVIQYFVDKYGEWILLEPRRQGFTLLVWLLPPLALAAGLVLLAIRLAQWTGRPAPAAATPVDADMRERIRREMGRET